IDIAAIAEPRFILLTWAAGMALAAGAVHLARIVGPGFTWLTGGVAGAIGLVGWGVAGTLASRLALGAVLLAMVLVRHRVAGVLLVAASIGYLIDAAGLGGWLLATTATLALGGITGEMALGHWYLVDPRMPRWALRTLGWVWNGGLLDDGIVLKLIGDITCSG